MKRILIISGIIFICLVSLCFSIQLSAEKHFPGSGVKDTDNKNIVSSQISKGKIDRYSLVNRHNVKVNSFDPLSAISVGNGDFAFTVDATGLQTFPEQYKKGIPLGTQSQWGWHSFPDTNCYKPEETLVDYNFRGRKEPYSVQVKSPKRAYGAVEYFRANAHRLHLGIIGLKITRKNGSAISISDISDIQQELNLWKGEIHSSFKVEGIPVEVFTYCHPELDLISSRINSPLVSTGRLQVTFNFPYATGKHVDDGCDWDNSQKHQTILKKFSDNSSIIEHKLDSSKYYAKIDWIGKASLKECQPHRFLLKSTGTEIEFSCLFSQKEQDIELPSVEMTKGKSSAKWKHFWENGGAVDFSGSTDVRANELERRVVLSQYLLAIQCAGKYPPQETGLTYNSWYGKFHLEMHWWHAAHFALWNRSDLLENSLNWYHKVLPLARKIAARQGFKGARWMKMTDTTGIESPSGVGSFLIWQQPHIIYMTELCYRTTRSKNFLNRYKDLVFESAEFMESFVSYDSVKKRYNLAGIIPAQETLNPNETFNSPFELAYWRWGLSTAQAWRVRLGMPRNKKWDHIIDSLSGLAKKEGLYLAAESAPDSYTHLPYYSDHPAVLGAFGFLPESPLFEKKMMSDTYDYIIKNWNWKKTWGWDFPFIAMTATRLGQPEKAIDALFMDVKTNTYLANGHNYQDDRLRLYLPGNGGLLAAVALMCAGYDGCKKTSPGIPKNGKWKVLWEGLQPMP